MSRATGNIPSDPSGYEPDLSAWVSASAGSGKTTLLTRRVLRLLLAQGEGLKLPNILCLTYTKAAAAEMQNRIHGHLSRWAIADDDALRDELHADFGVTADKDSLQRAQRLFSGILENPRHVRVMTVHAFCQYILGCFPLEAGIPPHFTLLEGKAEKDFGEAVLARFSALVRKEPALGQALDGLVQSVGGARLKSVLLQSLQGSAPWRKARQRMMDEGGAAAELLKLAGLSEWQAEEDFLCEFSSPQRAPETKLRYAAEILLGGGKTDMKRGENIAAWLEKNIEARAAGFDVYAACFLTQKSELLARLITAKPAKAHPDVVSLLEAEALRVLEASRQRAALRFIRRQQDFFRLASALEAIAADEKQRQAALTYDDLILKTSSLLQQSAMADWILYKLDAGIDHLLIDEAQDTSPEQWEVILSLLQEFYSGEGARANARRTLFVVGDDKQSIFSFQGAERNQYLQVRDTVMKKLKEAGKKSGVLERHLSYRTVPPLLSFVDTVFAQGVALTGVSQNPLQHSAARAKEPGFVELWPLLEPHKKETPPPWHPALEREDGEAAEVLLARQIASTISVWLKEGYWLKSKKRRLEAGDVMILLQRRSKLMLPIVRALKDAQIPIAGVDRMVLKEQAAVQDIVSFCRFLMLPQDDLALAEVLRGPLLRISDEQLFRLAHGREGSLWQAVQASPEMKAIHVYLGGFLKQVDYVPPFRILTALLTLPCPADSISGQHALTRRLGADAVDPIENLLAFALEVEQRQVASMQLFLRELNASDEEIKRELSRSDGNVRVLTVHGAKGLEAPVVILPDTARSADKMPKAPDYFWHPDGMALCAGEGDALVPAMQDAKGMMLTQRQEENRRLLYVALTRARDVMIICGVDSKTKSGTPTWYNMCLAGMEKLEAPQLDVENARHAWVYGDRAALTPKADAASAAPAAAVLPPWARARVKSETITPVLNPSRLGEGQEIFETPRLAATGVDAYLRGRLLHQLLQYLPDVRDEEREDFALAFLMRQSGSDKAACAVDAKEVLAVIRHPEFAPVFSSESQPEVPIIGRIKGRMISGQIDRLVVREKDVLIVDYKTNRPPPATLEAVPEAYLAQMAAYHHLLSRLYPDRRIRCALLWTHVLRLMELDEAALAKGAMILHKAA
jgi:ATP-dependent helicase/nuclease subunit A